MMRRIIIFNRILCCIAVCQSLYIVEVLPSLVIFSVLYSRCLIMGIMLRAVVIGINEYKDERYRHRARLRYASSDAQKIASLLRSSTMFTAERVTLLTNEEATRKTVRNCLGDTFSTRAFESNTIALFYFAGHGIVNPHDKRIWLC